MEVSCNRLQGTSLNRLGTLVMALSVADCIQVVTSHLVVTLDYQPRAGVSEALEIVQSVSRSIVRELTQT